MTAVDTLFAEIQKLHAEGEKPFRIAKRILSSAEGQRQDATLRGTLNDCQLIFESGEVITFDGREWHYQPPRRKQAKPPAAAADAPAPQSKSPRSSR